MFPGDRQCSAVFATTHWSVILEAGQEDSPEAQAALERLCRTYWYPLYAFLRRQGKTREEAEDLTQEFFARFLQKGFIRLADPERGRFRTFLLASIQNLSAEQHRFAGRLKRGGGRTILSWDGLEAEQRYLLEPQDDSTPESLYEKRWALTVLETALDRLRLEFASAGKERLFVELKSCLWSEGEPESYASLAARLHTTEGALKVTVHRLRQRFRTVLREEVAHTVADARELEDELRHLIITVRR